MLLAVHVVLIICNLKFEQHIIICVQLIVCMNSIHNTELDREWFNSWASVSEPIITWTVLMEFLYVCMYVRWSFCIMS